MVVSLSSMAITRSGQDNHRGHCWFRGLVCNQVLHARALLFIAGTEDSASQNFSITSYGERGPAPDRPLLLELRIYMKVINGEELQESSCASVYLLSHWLRPAR